MYLIHLLWMSSMNFPPGLKRLGSKSSKWSAATPRVGYRSMSFSAASRVAPNPVRRSRWRACGRVRFVLSLMRSTSRSEGAGHPGGVFRGTGFDPQANDLAQRRRQLRFAARHALAVGCVGQRALDLVQEEAGFGIAPDLRHDVDEQPTGVGGGDSARDLIDGGVVRCAGLEKQRGLLRLPVMAVSERTALREDLVLDAIEGAVEERLRIAPIGLRGLAENLERVVVGHRAAGAGRDRAQRQLLLLGAAMVVAERALDRHRDGDRAGTGVDAADWEEEVLFDALAQGEKAGIELGVGAFVEAMLHCVLS